MDYAVVHSGRRTIAIQIQRDGRVVVRAPYAATAEDIRRGTPVLKAAMEAGFDDYSAFLRAFQAAYGMSPREWK